MLDWDCDHSIRDERGKLSPDMGKGGWGAMGGYSRHVLLHSNLQFNNKVLNTKYKQ